MKTIHHVIDLDADTLVVWAALTEPDRMAGWWSTKVEAPPVRAKPPRVQKKFAELRRI